MDVVVYSCGLAVWNGQVVRCALGRGGVSADKREGDGATPAGEFRLRQVLYRSDRLSAPETGLATLAIRQNDGWSDDPADPDYNRRIALPHAFGHEVLWREDRIYDVVVPLGYNDDPPIAGKGSAIFLHIARPDFTPTEGCVALATPDLRRLLAACRPGDRLCIRLPPR